MFQLQNDMDNYWQWFLTRNVKQLRLKPGVVPHRYDCQRTNTAPVERKAALKRKRASLVQDALLEASTSSASSSTSQQQPQDDLTSSASGPGEEPSGHVAVHRDVGVQFRSHYRSKGTSTDLVPTHSVNLSPIKTKTEEVGTAMSSEDEIEDSDSEYEGETSSHSNYSSDENELEKTRFRKLMLECTITKIEKNPKLFLGLPPKSYYLISELVKNCTKLSKMQIFIVLKKIKLHQSYALLAIDFGLSIGSISKIFNSSLYKMANQMQELIVWPDVEDIKLRLPIPFRARYSSVNTIIDCLEIEIVQPSDSVEQTLTWSAYYGCNTIKYLVGCTPDGLITFVSEGFGGRTSDLVIVKESGFIKNLKPGTAVMADRGFKHLAPDLQQIGCSVIRPPSVSSKVKITKGEVKESQRIAALRIHVERVIGRIREFKMLGPHACISYKQIRAMDKVIIVACGIINLQDKLFKK